MNSVIKALGDDVYQLSLIEEHQLFCTAAYVIKGKEKNVLIETGTSPVHDRLISALKELGIGQGDLDAVVGTHIHLDHTGGAGLLMEQFPKAKIYVHEKGAIHLSAPEKLIAGSKEVYQDKFDRFFSPVVPVSEENIVPVKGLGELDLGDGRVIKFYDAPGHALHHIFIYDPVSESIFTGDAAGLYYKGIERKYGVTVCLPATTPTQFDPDAMRRTLDQMLRLSPKKLCFTHFGVNEEPETLIAQTKSWIDFFSIECANVYKECRSGEALYTYIEKSLYEKMAALGIPKEEELLTFMMKENKLNAQGVVYYVNRLERI